MNKTELIDHISKQAEISRAKAGKALDAVVGGVPARPLRLREAA